MSGALGPTKLSRSTRRTCRSHSINREFTESSSMKTAIAVSPCGAVEQSLPPAVRPVRLHRPLPVPVYGLEAGLPPSRLMRSFTRLGVIEVAATSTVPEPMTVTLMGTGLLGVMGVGYSRRRKAAE